MDEIVGNGEEHRALSGYSQRLSKKAHELRTTTSFGVLTAQKIAVAVMEAEKQSPQKTEELCFALIARTDSEVGELLRAIVHKHLESLVQKEARRQIHIEDNIQRSAQCQQQPTSITKEA